MGLPSGAPSPPEPAPAVGIAAVGGAAGPGGGLVEVTRVARVVVPGEFGGEHVEDVQLAVAAHPGGDGAAGGHGRRPSAHRLSTCPSLPCAW
jgi:hypothetical protein